MMRQIFSHNGSIVKQTMTIRPIASSSDRTTHRNDAFIHTIMRSHSLAFLNAPDLPFTIIVPKLDTDQIHPDRRTAAFLLEHLIPGVAFSTFDDEDEYGNLVGHRIAFAKLHGQNESQWTLNGVRILRTAVLGSRLSAIFIDGSLPQVVSGGEEADPKAAFAKRNIQEVVNRYNAPERLEMKNATKEEHLRLHRREQQQAQPVVAASVSASAAATAKPSALLTFLAGMKSGTKVFQHFLNKSKLTQDLDGRVEGYAVVRMDQQNSNRPRPTLIRNSQIAHTPF